MLFSFALCSLLLLLLLRLLPLLAARLDSCKVFVTGRGRGVGGDWVKGRAGEKKGTFGNLALLSCLLSTAHE